MGDATSKLSAEQIWLQNTIMQRKGIRGKSLCACSPYSNRLSRALLQSASLLLHHSFACCELPLRHPVLILYRCCRLPLRYRNSKHFGVKKRRQQNSGIPVYWYHFESSLQPLTGTCRVLMKSLRAWLVVKLHKLFEKAVSLAEGEDGEDVFQVPLA